jgi:hypothetical protein
MEHGKLDFESGGLVTVFIFDGLVATLQHPKLDRRAVKAQRWSAALYAWRFEPTVCAHLRRLVTQYGVTVEIVTWHPAGFAALVHERLWALDVPVAETHSEEFAEYSPRVATDCQISEVYDPDPDHRWAYGFKTREFFPGVLY